MDRFTHTCPIIEIQLKKQEFLCVREHEFHESYEFHKPIRYEYFLIRGE